MTLLSTLGLGPLRKIRYGIVALGDISQEAMLPGIKHTGNSEVTAFVTGDAEKARLVGERYGVRDSYGYEQFDEMLRSGKVDAIYLATPNWRHAEFIIPALRSGIHVLAEKPLEISTAKAQAILDAQQGTTAKLMVAYRLHFEPANLATIETIRNGDLGEILLFTSTFAQRLDPENHRAKYGDLAGPVLDMGPYPVNAARYIFGDEPIEIVSAIGTRNPEAGLGDFDDTVAVTLRFPLGRIAQFSLSYFANRLDTYTVVGTKCSVVVNPAYTYGSPLERIVTIGAEKRLERFKDTDQFGGEMRYFSDCILANLDPEPDGEEGYADVRVLEGILEALKTGRPHVLPPFIRTRRIDPGAQLQRLATTRPPVLVNARNPGKRKKATAR